jgi:xanthine dehydrogenase YagS FAD-binding subunit
MINFQYARANDIADAVRQIAADPTAKFIAGGTNLIDLMKEDVERPTRLIDITRLPLKTVEETPDGGLRIGSLVPNADLAYHQVVEKRYPLLGSAILAGASQQLRNMASTGGNLLQRTRCYYFYDTATPCNKREPGRGCSAINGFNRMHAILGATDACIATHPSDMCVALAVLEASIHVRGPGGERSIAFADFHRLPGDTPHIETNLRADEIITIVTLPPRAAVFSSVRPGGLTRPVLETPRPEAALLRRLPNQRPVAALPLCQALSPHHPCLVMQPMALLPAMVTNENRIMLNGSGP